MPMLLITMLLLLLMITILLVCVSGLMDAIAQFRGFDETHLASFGRTAGSERMMLQAEAAEKNRPQLAQFDAYGEYSSFRYNIFLWR
jgi:hypothetical protein